MSPSSSSRRELSTAASNATSSWAVHSASVEWPVESMRISRDIGYLLGDLASGASYARVEALLNHALDLAAVGPALGLAHHGADDGADRLALARLDLLHGGGVLLEGAIHDVP